MLDLAQRRIERSITVIRRALKHDAAMQLSADAPEQGLDQPRLAHAGFGGEHDRLSLALPRQMPAVEQQAHFLRPADKGAEADGAGRRKTAGDRRFFQDAPGRDRLGKSLELMLAQTLVIEAAREQAAGGLADHDGIGLGQCLQTGGEVRRFSDDRFFARGAAADNIADHDDAGCDADPGLQ